MDFGFFTCQGENRNAEQRKLRDKLIKVALSTFRSSDFLDAKSEGLKSLLTLKQDYFLTCSNDELLQLYIQQYIVTEWRLQDFFNLELLVKIGVAIFSLFFVRIFYLLDDGNKMPRITFNDL